jgi:hypothetical protein
VVSLLTPPPDVTVLREFEKAKRPLPSAKKPHRARRR